MAKSLHGFLKTAGAALGMYPKYTPQVAEDAARVRRVLKA